VARAHRARPGRRSRWPSRPEPVPGAAPGRSRGCPAGVNRPIRL
jgi:hypothetical protein